MRDHRLIDERSRAFCRLIAEKVAANPQLVLTARATVERWLITCSPATRSTLLEWQAALEHPIASILSILTATDERATRLRQSNPFVGVLSRAERSAILWEFQARESAVRVGRLLLEAIDSPRIPSSTTKVDQTVNL